MKVKVPSAIQFGAHLYHLFLSGDSSIAGADGTSYHREERVIVNKEIPEMRRNVNLLHESLHIIDRVWDLNLNEADVVRISEGLGQLLFGSLGIELDWSEIKEVELKC